jgi:hypothetical protein
LDPSSGSDSLYLVEITYSVSHVPVMCVNRCLAAYSGHMVCVCVCVCERERESCVMLRTTVYRLSLPDDGSYVIRNMLE